MTTGISESKKTSYKNKDLEKSVVKLSEYSDLDNKSFNITVQKRDNKGKALGETKTKKLYIKYHKKNKSFKLYEKSNNFGTVNISSEVSYKIKKTIGTGYCESVIPNIRKNYLMIDAISLEKLISKQVIKIGTKNTKKNIVKNTIKNLAEKERENNDYLQQKFSIPKELLTKYRIFLDKEKINDNNWKVCIDRKERKYLVANEEQLPGLTKYLQGDAFLRRKKDLPVQPFPISKIIQRRRFETEEKLDNGINLIIDGADDTANALSSSGLPQQTVDAIQSLVIFPTFLSLVELGVSGLSSEKNEKIEEITKIRENIVKCREKISTINAAIDKIKKSEYKILPKKEKEQLYSILITTIESISKLQQNLSDLSEAVEDYRSAAYLGHPAMIAMFAGVSAYQLQAFTNLLGGINGFSKGLESTNAIQKLNIHGGKLGENLSVDIPLGIAGIVGNITIFAGQCLMTGFAISKVISEGKKISEINEEINNITKSDMMSEPMKQIQKAFKKDEKLYSILKLSGNGMLGAGQAAMAICGPVGFALNPGVYTGLGLTLFGVALNTATELREGKLYGYDEELSDLEKDIIAESRNKTLKQVISDIRIKQIKEIIDEIKNEKPKFNKLTKEDIDQIFRDAKTHNGYSNMLFNIQNQNNVDLRKEFSVQFQRKCKKNINFTNRAKEKYVQKHGMRTKSVLDYINVESLYNVKNNNSEKYINIARESSFQIELLVHLQSIPLVINKIFKESNKHNCDYQTAFRRAKNHYSGRRHQIGLLNTLENIQLQQDIKEILNNTDKKELSKTRKLAIWNDITDVLRPKESDLSWIKKIASLLANDKKTNILEIVSLIQKDTEKNTPLSIKSKLEGFKGNYEDLIKYIQQGYIENKIQNLQLNKYDEMNDTEIKIESSKKILDGELATEFQKRIMQHTYVKENRKNFRKSKIRKKKYIDKSEETPIHIIGQVKKINGGFFCDTSHKKNIYEFNDNLFNKNSFVPTKRIFYNFLNKDKKYNLRSNYHRPIRVLDVQPLNETINYQRLIYSK